MLMGLETVGSDHHHKLRAAAMVKKAAARHRLRLGGMRVTTTI